MTGITKNKHWINLLTKLSPSVNMLWLKTHSQGAATRLRLAAMDDEEFIQKGGKYYEDCNVATPLRTDVINDGTRSDELRRLLWDLSEKMIDEYSIVPQ